MLMLLLLAGISNAEGAASASTLRLVTYNTHGLPSWIAGDAPRQRFPIIGERLGAYPIALVQEDFFHHDLLESSVTHDVLVRGNEDSGLTTLLGIPGAQVLETARIAYDSCEGWLGSAMDCWADKGFLRVRVRLASGAVLDVVNTHLEAGNGEADQAVRERQLGVLVQHLEAVSPDGALVVGGDLNLKWTVPHERALLESMMRALRLVDTGAEPALDSDFSRLDYLLYRNGANTRIEVQGAGMAKEFENGGAALSDHPALWATLRVVHHRVVEIPPSTGMMAPVTYAPARDAR
jgi:hypothetical protein